MKCTTIPTVNTNYGSKESDSPRENLTDNVSAEKPRSLSSSPLHSLHEFAKGLRRQPRQGSRLSPLSLVQQLWQRLAAVRAPEPAEYHDDNDVECNDSGVKCLKKSCVEVEKAHGTVVLHANRLDIASTDRNAAKTLAKSSYVVGQSPVSENRCESFLVHAMKSGDGIYQFVSEKTHRRMIDGKKSFAESGQKERSILEEIRTKLALSRSEHSKYVIDGKHEIVGLREIGSNGNGSEGNLSQSNTHCHFLLEFREQANGPLKTIPITQAGFAFKEKTLRGEQLREANACLATHIGLRNNSDAKGNIAEMVLSYAGIGRNAALIVFSEASKMIEADQITTESELDTALENLINQGRAVRGPHFLHSKAQLQEIRNTCIASLNARIHFRYPSDDAFLRFSDSESDTDTDTDLDFEIQGFQENFEDDMLPVQHPPVAQTAIYLEPGRNPDHLDNANESASEEEVLDDMAPLTEPLAPFRPAESVTAPILESNASPKISASDKTVPIPTAASLDSQIETPRVVSGATAPNAPVEHTPPPVPFVSFGAGVIDLDEIDRRLLTLTHHVRKMECSDNGSWWRAAFLSALMGTNYSESDEIAAQRLYDRVAALGDDLISEAKLLKDMAEKLRLNDGTGGIHTVLTDLEPETPKEHFKAFSSRLKAVGEADNDPSRPGETALKKIARAMLLKAGYSHAAVEKLMSDSSPREGSPDDVRALISQFGQERSQMFMRPRKDPSTYPTNPVNDDVDLNTATLDIAGLKDFKGHEIVKPEIEEESGHTYVEMVGRSLNARPVAVFDDGHFGISVPTGYVRNTPAQKLLLGQR